MILGMSVKLAHNALVHLEFNRYRAVTQIVDWQLASSDPESMLANQHKYFDKDFSNGKTHFQKFH